MIVAYAPLLVAIVGVLIYAFATNTKLNRIGEHMIWTGLLVTLMSMAGKTVHLF